MSSTYNDHFHQVTEMASKKDHHSRILGLTVLVVWLYHNLFFLLFLTTARHMDSSFNKIILQKTTQKSGCLLHMPSKTRLTGVDRALRPVGVYFPDASQSLHHLPWHFYYTTISPTRCAYRAQAHAGSSYQHK